MTRWHWWPATGYESAAAPQASRKAQTRSCHACKLGLEGAVSKRKDSAYRSGRSPDWLKMKNPAAPAVKREAEASERRGTLGGGGKMVPGDV
jgi:hypothetical protein